MPKDIHFKEDTSKPENRVNLTLFHLMMVDEIRNFVLDKLNISRESVIYPCPNLTTEEFDTSSRPDFAIKNEDQLRGYIEVELGTEDAEQLHRYRTQQSLPVYSIIGKRMYGPCDLSLEELYDHLTMIQPRFCGTQFFQSIRLLKSLIEYYVIQGNFSTAKPIALSDAMRKSRLVKYFYEYFGSDLILENAPVQRNKVMFNTRGENGFSLRVFSTETGSFGLSLMNRTGGRQTIYFPAHKKLLRYLPDSTDAIQSYSNFIADLGAKEIFRIDENKRCSLPLEIVESNVDKFCKLINDIIHSN
jgi:hypothetical protein